MTSRSGVQPVAALFMLLACSNVASATPFTFTYTTTITIPGDSSFPMIPGVSLGDTLTVNVTLDNGNSSLVDQAWSVDQVISATSDVGTYHATYVPPWSTPGMYYFCSVAFKTDSDGFVSDVCFYDPAPAGNSNTDSFGTGGYAGLYVNGISDVYGDLARWPITVGYNDTSLWSPYLWTDDLGRATPVPEPSTVGLFAVGIIAGLALSGGIDSLKSPLVTVWRH